VKLDLKKRRFQGSEGRLIPRKKYPKPFRFVGLGIIIMLVIIVILYKLVVR
jgi:uncharacterized membrane protein YukC